GILAVFRSPLTEQDIQSLVREKEALNKLTGYSLLQLEGEGRGFVVHPVVSEYVLAKVGKQECNNLHKKASDFYIHQHDDLFKKVSKERRAEPLEMLCDVMKMLAQRGMREQADAITSSLLEIHHHLFEAAEYEQAGGIVTSICGYLDMQGLRELAKEMLKKSIDSREGSGKYVSMANLANLLIDEGKWQEALDTCGECLEFFKSIDAKSQMSSTISQQAQIYQDRGNYEQAISLEQEALALNEEVGSKRDIVVSHYRIAQLLHLMEKYDKALKHLEKGLQMERELKHPEGEAKYLHQFGLTLNRLNRPREAFERFIDSLAIAEQIGDKSGQAGSLIEIGKLLRRIEQFKEALDCYQQALNIFRDLGDPVKVAIALEHIGLIFEDQGHYQEALIKYQEALQLQRQYGNPQIQALVERHIARVKKQISNGGK
ncbi:MAG: tetratricopeptide repeat protein, partial [Phycisphaerae bacterium]|nr:tetratricopeptide repeat protein [Phycisphaerae bacterium]NIP53958.1 tetratricopeptide repeat protein [Phycisphaerae bacterium]NIS52881.1 tetratricopeptide repeat protein [Phycisphaerae bacterium]NIU10353.1 tetratricopeptide repeat protein [Phycisphaerae bacterium]NIU58050.1 tetratricopeptide repeat protein [Phycisphaerae bacterium]